MQVFVKCQRLHALSVGDGETVNALKTLLEEFEGIRADNLTLRIRGGKVLGDDQILSNVLADGAHVDASVSVLGGKKLTLNRAGKVRAQTPRVEKIDRKKKRKTGRAKKRQQYSKRFLNSISGNGRSPNSNQEYF